MSTTRRKVQTLPAIAPSATGVELNKNLKKAIAVIDKRLRELGVDTVNDPYQTTGNFKYNENDSNNINILSCVDVNYLIKSLAMVKRVKAEYIEAAESLGLTTYPQCLWFGNPIDKWIHDLTMRARIVANQLTINELGQSRAELTTFLSQEDRLVSTLETVRKRLGITD